MFGSKEYCLSCDQQCLPEAILVTAGIKIAVVGRAVERKLDLVDWHAVPPLLNLLAFQWEGGLVKNIAFASLSKSLAG